MVQTADILIEAIGYQRDGAPRQAETLYRQVLAREPAHPSALYLYGVLRLQQGRPGQAVNLLERAALVRDDGDTLLHLARARLACGQASAALAASEAAIRSGGISAEALYIKGTALNAAERWDEAAAILTEATARNPAHAASRLNLGNALLELDRLDEAEAHIRAAILLDPALTSGHASLGHLLTRLGQLDEAAESCRRALALNDKDPAAHWNLATALLLAGDLAAGFAEYEWRKRHPRFSHHFRRLPGREWQGETLDGDTLLILAEQGLGDTIQFARFLPALQASGARTVLACARPLVPLLQGQTGIDDVVPRSAALAGDTVWVDQMSLPRLLRTDIAGIPGAGGYLQVSHSAKCRWAERFPAARIGLAWAGNPQHPNDIRRSIPAELLPGLVRPDAISLQLGPRANEALALGLPVPLPALCDYAETAALIATLELVITVDTSVAHLAGALGVPVWIMLPHAPDWRWIAGRDDTPWYRSARLFRQERPGDWPGVISRIRAALPSAVRPLAPAGQCD